MKVFLLKIVRKKDKTGIDELLSQAESNIKRDRALLFGAIILIEGILIVISVALKWFSVSGFIINIINNIVGILPPMLLFDYFYEKISSESSSIEMSKKITATMMGQPETLKLFNIEDRKKFLKSTVNSVISDADLTDMILDNVNRYVIDPSTLEVRIRKEFSYNFELDEDLPEDYNVIFGDTLLATKDYYLVQEILNYTAKQFSSKIDIDKCEVCIGFAFCNDSLDDALRDKATMIQDENEEKKAFFVFRESLDLSYEHRQRLIEYLNSDKSEKTKEQKFAEISRLYLKINNRSAELKKVIVKESGIICTFRLDEVLNTDDYSVRVIFSMPKKWGTVIEIALVDPTFSPKITLSYPRDKMNIDMYSFLNKSDNSSNCEAHEHLNGVYDISLKEWVYPISGIIFTVNRKEIK